MLLKEFGSPSIASPGVRHVSLSSHLLLDWRGSSNGTESKELLYTCYFAVIMFVG